MYDDKQPSLFRGPILLVALAGGYLGYLLIPENLGNNNANNAKPNQLEMKLGTAPIGQEASVQKAEELKTYFNVYYKGQMFQFKTPDKKATAPEIGVYKAPTEEAKLFFKK